MGPGVNVTSANETGMQCVPSPSSRPGGTVFTFKRVQEDLDPAVLIGPLLTSNGASTRRLLKGQADGSDDERSLLRALRHRPWINYEECETSSDESDFEQMNGGARSSALPIGVVRGCAYCEGCQKVLTRWRPEAGCRPLLDEAPVFFPLEEEFRDTLKYIASISDEAEQYGICRIVPPHSWRPPCPLKDSEKRQTSKFPTRVQQLDKLQVREAQVKRYSQSRKRRRGRPPRREGNSGQRFLPSSETHKDASYESDEEGKFGFEPGPKLTLAAFEKYAHQFKEDCFGIREQIEACCDSKMRQEPSIESIEGEYWRIVEHATEQIEVLYGADIETREFGSGFPMVKPGAEPTFYESSGWNLNNLSQLPGSVLSFEEAAISGVVVPWLYVGMCFSSFCWHVEDHHFYSLNYMHFGAPKVWYGVPSSAAHKLEDAMKKHLPELFEEQPDLLHKLVTQLSPSVLKAAGVPVYRAVQKPGEFVVTFPKAYHAGFNSGFNCAEAVNVAPIDWLPHGQSAVELYREQRRKSSVAHDKLLIGAATHAVKSLHHSRVGKTDAKVDESCSAWQESSCQIEVLVNVLKNRVDMEWTRRANIEDKVSIRKMDRSFDAVHEKECSICHYDLHLSAIGCECVPDRYTCLEHGQQLCACERTKKFALFRYELSELNILVAALKGRLDAVNSWLDLERVVSLKPSSFADIEPSKELSTSLSTLQKVPLNPKGGLDSIEGDPMSRFVVKPLVPQDSKEKKNSGFMSGESAWDFHGQKQKMIKSPIDIAYAHDVSHSVPLNYEKNVDVFGKAEAFEERLEKEKLSISFESDKIEYNSGAGQQNSWPVQDPFNGQLSGVKRDVEVIVLSDDEDDSSGCALSSGSCGMNTSLGPDRNSQKLANCSSSKKGPAVLQLGQGNNTLWSIASSDQEPQPIKPFGQERTIGTSPMGGTNLIVKLQHSLEDTVIPASSYGLSSFGELEMTNKLGADINKNWLCYGSAEGSSFEPTRSFMTMDKSGSQQPQTEQPILHTPLIKETKEFDDYRLVSVSDPNPTLAVGKSRRVGELGLHGYPSLGLSEDTGYKVDLLDIGRLVLQKSWFNKHAIFPAGFRSRVLFPSIINPFQSCFYISEVLDSGHAEPLFKVVMEDHPNEVFIHPCIDTCWQMVQGRVNTAIQLRHDLGNLRLHFLRPPTDIKGIDLFGFTSPHIKKAVERLDWRHQCIEYWAGRLSAFELLEYQHQVRVARVNQGDCTERINNFKEPFVMVPFHSSQKILETASASFSPTEARHNV